MTTSTKSHVPRIHPNRSWARIMIQDFIRCWIDRLKLVQRIHLLDGSNTLHYYIVVTVMVCNLVWLRKEIGCVALVTIKSAWIAIFVSMIAGLFYWFLLRIFGCYSNTKKIWNFDSIARRSWRSNSHLRLSNAKRFIDKCVSPLFSLSKRMHGIFSNFIEQIERNECRPVRWLERDAGSPGGMASISRRGML